MGAQSRGADSPDGQLVVTAAENGKARVWDAASGRLLSVFSGLRYHVSGVHDGVLWAEFSPDGSRVVTAGDDRTVRIWDAHLETRTPDEMDDLLKRLVRLRLEGETLVPVVLPGEATGK